MIGLSEADLTHNIWRDVKCRLCNVLLSVTKILSTQHRLIWLDFLRLGKIYEAVHLEALLGWWKTWGTHEHPEKKNGGALSQMVGVSKLCQQMEEPKWA